MNRESQIAGIEFIITFALLGCINGLTMGYGNVMVILSPVIVILMIMTVIRTVRIIWINEKADIKQEINFKAIMPNLRQWREGKTIRGTTIWSNSNV